MTAPTTRKTVHVVNQLDDRSYTLHFRVKRESLYAQRRAVFFERIHVLAMFCALIGGATSTVTLLERLPAWLGPVGAFAATVFIALDFVTGAVKKYYAYQSRVDALGMLNEKMVPLRNFSDDEFAALSVEYAKIFRTKIPPTKSLLLSQCHYTTLRSFGGKRDQMAHFGWLQRMTAQLFSWADYAQNAAPDPKHPVGFQQPHSAAG